MTIGIVKGLNFPSSVTNSQLGYKKKIAEQFIEVNLLTSAEAHLNNGRLENWLVKFSIDKSESIICLNVEVNNEYVSSFKSNSSEHVKKLNNFVDFVWDNCDTIYEFVIITDNILRSHRSASYMKKNIMNIIVELRMLMSKS